MQLSLEVKNAQILVQMPGESVFIASQDGSTFTFRGDQAKRLRDKYAEQKRKSKWDMRVQVNIEVAEPKGARL
jgi:hypothetical protein